MSRTLMQHVKMLAVGVALTAMTLAMAPGVANAETKLDGKVDAALKGDGSGANKGDDRANLDGKADGALKNGGNGEANLDGKVDGVLKSGAGGDNLGNTAVDNATKSDHRVDLNDPSLVGGDTKSITEVNAPIVPAEGVGKVDGNAGMDGLVDEGFCVRGALNQSASGCGGGSAGSDDNSNIDTAELPGNTTVDSVTDTDQRVDLSDPPLFDGDTTTINGVNSDLIPARGNADVDAGTEVDSLLEEELCGRVALNSGAGGCGSGNGDTDNENTDNGTDLGNTIADLGDTATNNDTTSDQQVNNDPLQSSGTTISNTDVIAPTVPASAKAELKGIVEAPGLVNQDVGICGTLNAENCGRGGSEPASAPDNGNGTGLDLGDLVTDLDGIDADSGTAIEENVNLDNLQQEGTVDNTNNVDAPAVPASAKAELKGDAKVGETVDQNINSCSTLNVECSGGSDAASDTGNGAGIDTGDPLANLDGTTANNDTTSDQQVHNGPLQSNGNTLSNTDVEAPAVPALAKAEGKSNVEAPGVVNQDVGVCSTLNAENCGGDAASAPDNAGIDLNDPLADLDGISANSVTNTDQRVNDDPLQSNGKVDNRNDIVAPAVPASGTDNLDGDGAVVDALNQDVSSCTDLNAAGCSGDTAASPDSGAGIDLGESFANLGDTTADSNTAIDQQANDDPLQSNGTIGNTDAVAPAVPASARTELDANGTLGDTFDQDGSVCGSVSSENCSGGDPIPAPGNESNDIAGGDPVGGLDGTNVNSATTIDETVNPNDPVLDGAAGNTNDIGAPAVPASATGTFNGTIAEDGPVSQDVRVCATLNAEDCGGDAVASPDGGAGIDLGDPVANLGANAVLEGGVILGADAALSGDAATRAGSDAALSSDAEPISASGDVALRSDVSLSGDVDRALGSDDAVTNISDSAALNGEVGSAPAGDDTTLGVDAAFSIDAGTTLSGDTRTALSGGAEPGPAGDDPSIILSDILGDEVGTPLTGSEASVASGDADTVPTGGNDGGPGKLALVDTNTDTTAVRSGEPTWTANPSDNGTQNLAAGLSKGRIRTLAASPLSGRSVALAAGPSAGKVKASASSGSATESGDRLPDTGGVSPLVLIGALLFVGFGTLLVARRRFNS